MGSLPYLLHLVRKVRKYSPLINYWTSPQIQSGNPPVKGGVFPDLLDLRDSKGGVRKLFCGLNGLPEGGV